jgi:uncharacterized protein involved in exopolysaccharide biosynthesis
MARSQLDSARARYSSDHPDVIRLQREVAGLEKQVGSSSATPSSAASSGINDLRRHLQSTRSALAEARERYGPEHPDRVRLEREVTDLEAQLAAAPAPAIASDASTQAPVEADNPAYVQIQAQLAATRNDLTALAAEMGKLRTHAAEYQSNVTLAPQVEKEYRELTRDYDNARIKYAEIRSKQSEAKTAQNLEADRKGERFTLIDPPLPPEEPVSPNRTLIFTVGFVLSIGLACAVLWLLETLDTTVRGRKDLFQLTGIPPLALVPHIGTDADFRAGRRRIWLAAGTAATTVGVAVALTHFFYLPLDVLWFVLARRLGL